MVWCGGGRACCSCPEDRRVQRQADALSSRIKQSASRPVGVTTPLGPTMALTRQRAFGCAGWVRSSDLRRMASGALPLSYCANGGPLRSTGKPQQTGQKQKTRTRRVLEVEFWRHLSRQGSSASHKARQTGMGLVPKGRARRSQRPVQSLPLSRVRDITQLSRGCAVFWRSGCASCSRPLPSGR